MPRPIPEPTRVEPRLVLNRYQLVERLGHGGMAEVYLAQTRTFAGVQKTVVVKRIAPALAEHPEFVEMFMDEARIALRLEHPNIVNVFDVDRAHGEVFYVMEHLRGRDLREVVRRSWHRGIPTPLECALTLMVNVCAGVHHAHELRGDRGEPLGVVHRDLSPHNVFVTFDGAVKIIDFGIAKAEDRLSEHTGTGMVKGKLGYMSPEQCLALPVDRRSDVFSVGVMLYELTTGVRLFDGRSDYEATKKLVELPIVPPSSLRQSYPPELERIVMRSLERDRERRYASAAAMQDELEHFALRHHYPISSAGVARWMQQLFGESDRSAEGSSIVARAEPWLGDTATTSTVTPSHAPRRSRKWIARAVLIVALIAVTAALVPMTRGTSQVAVAAMGDALPTVQIPSAAPLPRPSVEMPTRAPRAAPPPRPSPRAPKPREPDLDAPLP